MEQSKENAEIGRIILLHWWHEFIAADILSSQTEKNNYISNFVMILNIFEFVSI